VPGGLILGDSAFLACAWRRLLALTWEVDAEALADRVPSGLELDTFEGRALVSLVGFLFLDTRALGIPLPFQQRFPEVNLRFYVRREAPEGPRRGVVFVKEVVPRWAIAAGARWLFDEPYCTRPMRHEGSGDGEEPRPGDPLSYEWREGSRWHGLSARVGAFIGPAPPGSLQEFVIERYWGYTRRRNGRTVEYRVRHPPWRLWAAGQPLANLDGPQVYGDRLGTILAAPPLSGVVADGSPVTVSWGRGLLAD
jgi:uncharacterized protein YqjF (DUF2071 family)